MMYIKVVGGDYGLFNGKVLPVQTIDDAGDAVLTDEYSKRYSMSYVFQGDYEEVPEAIGTAEYLLTLPIRDLTHLREIMRELPAELLAVSKLDKN